LIAEKLSFDLLLLLLSLIAGSYFIWNIKKTGKKPYVRTLAALEALPELVGRAAEMGRPIHFAGGQCGFTSPWVTVIPGIVNHLLVYGEVVRIAAPTNTRVIYTCGDPSNIPVAQDIAMTNAIKAGNPEYELDTRFISTNPRSYMSGIMGIVAREKISGQIGFLGGEETLTAVYAAAEVGALQIGGGTFIPNLCWQVTGCDYVLLGEEIMACSAILGDDPSMSGSIAGEDVIKILSMIIIILGAVLVTSGSTWLKDILVL
jgi:hypothetical protein